MTASSQSFPQTLMPSLARLHRFTVDEYRRMIAAGILTEDSDVELLEGRIVQKMSRNPPHDVVLDQTNEALRLRLSKPWRIRIQSAITLSPDSEPEPDIAVVVGPASRYIAHHPQPPDIVLVVEVSDSTLVDDRVDKGRIYARAGLPVYWIVNVRDQQVEVYADPRPQDPNPSYLSRHDYRLNEGVPLIIAGQHVGDIPVKELLMP